MSQRSLSQPDSVPPMKAKTPVVGEQARAGDLAQPVIDAGRDQMRADQAVGRGATDEIAAGDQPEIARAHAGRRGRGTPPRADCRSDRRRPAAIRLAAIGGKAEILRPVAHQPRDQRQEERRRCRPGQSDMTRQPALVARAPSSAGRRAGRPRWPRSGCRRRAPRAAEPARGDEGRQVGADKAGRRCRRRRPTAGRAARARCIAGVSATPQRSPPSARVIVRRAPKRSITAAANGPTAP